MSRRKLRNQLPSTEQLLDRARAALDNRQRVLDEFRGWKGDDKRRQKDFDKTHQSWEEFIREYSEYVQAVRAPHLPVGAD